MNTGPFPSREIERNEIFEIIVVYGSYPTIFDAIKNLQKCRWRHKSHILSVTRPFMDLILKNNRPQFRIIPRRVQQKSNEWFPSIFIFKDACKVLQTTHFWKHIELLLRTTFKNHNHLRWYQYRSLWTSPWFLTEKLQNFRHNCTVEFCYGNPIITYYLHLASS